MTAKLQMFATLPADQQEPARKEWVNVLAPVQAPRAVAVTGYGEGVNVVQFQRSENGKCHDIA